MFIYLITIINLVTAFDTLASDGIKSNKKCLVSPDEALNSLIRVAGDEQNLNFKLLNTLEALFIKHALTGETNIQILEDVIQRLEKALDLISKSERSKNYYNFNFDFNLSSIQDKMVKSLEEAKNALKKASHSNAQKATNELRESLEKNYFYPFNSSLIEMYYIAREKNIIAANIEISGIKQAQTQDKKELANFKADLKRVYKKIAARSKRDKVYLRKLKNRFEREAQGSIDNKANLRNSEAFLNSLLFKEIDIISFNEQYKSFEWVEVKLLKDIEIGSTNYLRVINQAKKTLFLANEILLAHGFQYPINHKIIFHNPIPDRLKEELEMMGIQVKAPL